MYYLADEGSSTHSTSKRNTNNNYRLLKLSSVILWLAECETELGNLQAAEGYINQIRNRAKNGSVQDVTVTYAVNPYPTGTFTAKGADYARNAIRMENRLEFAMEGHRFFDLVRWGIAEKYLNKYVKEESVDGKDLAGRTRARRGSRARARSPSAARGQHRPSRRGQLSGRLRADGPQRCPAGPAGRPQRSRRTGQKGLRAL